MIYQKKYTHIDTTFWVYKNIWNLCDSYKNNVNNTKRFTVFKCECVLSNAKINFCVDR